MTESFAATSGCVKRSVREGENWCQQFVWTTQDRMAAHSLGRRRTCNSSPGRSLGKFHILLPIPSLTIPPSSQSFHQASPSTRASLPGDTLYPKYHALPDAVNPQRYLQGYDTFMSFSNLARKCRLHPPHSNSSSGIFAPSCALKAPIISRAKADVLLTAESISGSPLKSLPTRCVTSAMQRALVRLRPV